MLTADAFGVLPPIAKLTREQAMYHFLSGYTAKVAGTERGVSEPQATFSTCFGAPFMVHHPTVYAQLLGQQDRRARRRSAGSSIPAGRAAPTASATACRSRIRARWSTRRSRAASRDELRDRAVLWLDDSQAAFPDVPSEVLNPRNAWADKAAYDEQARKLSQLFFENFKRFEMHVWTSVNAVAIRPLARS